MSGKKRLSFAVALIFLLVSALGTFVLAADGLEDRRLGGKDRYFTAIEISKEWESSEYVILATGQNYADALAAAPLAAALDAPILLTRNSWIDTNMYVFDAILERIDELNPRKIFILSSSKLVSTQVEEALSEKYEVERIFGDNRYETSAKIAEKMEELGHKVSKEAFITDGYDFKGALTVSGYAAQNGCPIFFASSRTDRPELNKLNDIVKQTIIDLGIEKVTVVGNIAPGVISELESMSIEVEVIPVDSMIVAEKYEDPAGIIIARGDEWADALVGGAMAAKLGYPMVLLSDGTGDELPEEIKNYIKENTTIEDARYLGGSAVISDAICEEIEALIKANYQANRYAEALENMVSAHVQDADFGSRVTVTLSELGQIYYPAAVEYQLYDADKAISGTASLNEPVTVFPKKAAGDEVLVKLLDSNGAELLSKTVALKADAEDEINAFIDSALFGSRVTVSITVNGVADYPSAVSYIVCDNNGEEVTAIAALGESTTIFPAQEAGSTVVVKLLDSNGAVLVSKNVELIKNTEDIFKVYASDADFGSRLSLEIIVAGTYDYPSAVSYQLFEGENAVSSIASLNEPVTVFPAKAEGDLITVKLLDANGNVLVSKEVEIEANPEDRIVAYLNDAAFGSRITVRINQKGAADYPSAVSYQLFKDDTAVSGVTTLGGSVTVMPKAELGDTYTVKLLDANGSVVAVKEVSLIKPGIDLFEGIEIGDVPKDPEEEPTEPGEEPTEPGEEPTEPGEEPTEPGEEPTEPGEEPTEPPADEPDEYVLTCTQAIFGSNLNFSIIVKGEPDYPDAVKYRVKDINGEPLTNLNGTALGKNTTIFPPPAEGTVVIVEILNNNLEVIGTMEMVINITN